MKNLLLKGILTTAILSSYGIASHQTVSDELKAELQTRVNKHHFFVDQQQDDNQTSKKATQLFGANNAPKFGSVKSTLEEIYDHCKTTIPKKLVTLNSLIEQYTSMYARSLKETPVQVGDETVDLYTIFLNSNTLFTNILTLSGLNKNLTQSLESEGTKIIAFIKKRLNLKAPGNLPIDGIEVAAPDPLGDMKIEIPFTAIAQQVNTHFLKDANPSTTPASTDPIALIDPIVTPVLTTPVVDSTEVPISTPSVPVVSTSLSPIPECGTPVTPTTSQTPKVPLITPSILENPTILNEIQAHLTALLQHINEAAKSTNKYQREIARDIKIEIKKSLKEFLKSF